MEILKDDPILRASVLDIFDVSNMRTIKNISEKGSELEVSHYFIDKNCPVERIRKFTVLLMHKTECYFSVDEELGQLNFWPKYGHIHCFVEENQFSISIVEQSRPWIKDYKVVTVIDHSQDEF